MYFLLGLVILAIANKFGASDTLLVCISFIYGASIIEYAIESNKKD